MGVVVGGYDGWAVIGAAVGVPVGASELQIAGTEISPGGQVPLRM